MHNDPLALSCSLAFLRGWSYSSWKSLAKKKKTFLTTSKACVQKVTAQDTNSELGYHLTRVSVTYAGIGVRYLWSCSACQCHVLCVMLERVLRTCPDGAVFPFFMQATGALGWFSSDPALTTVLWTVTWDCGPEVETIIHQEGHSGWEKITQIFET